MNTKTLKISLAVAMLLAVPFLFVVSNTDNSNGEREFIESYVEENGIVEYLDNYGSEDLVKYCTEEYIMDHMAEYIVGDDDSTPIIIIYFDEETQTIKGEFADTLDKGRFGSDSWEEGRYAGYYIYFDSVTMDILVSAGPIGAGALVAGILVGMSGPAAGYMVVLGAFIGGMIGQVIKSIIDDRLDYSNGWVLKIKTYTVRNFLGLKFKTPSTPELWGSWPQSG